MTFYLFLCHHQCLRFFRDYRKFLWSSNRALIKALEIIVPDITDIVINASGQVMTPPPPIMLPTDHSARGLTEYLSKLGKSRHGNIGPCHTMAGHACITVTRARVTRMRLKLSVVRPRDNIRIIETLGPLSAESMRPSPSRTPHLSILRWLGRGTASNASHWSITRHHCLWLVHQRPGGWSGSGGWWWPDYEYSVSITNGGKKPAESPVQIQTHQSHN